MLILLPILLPVYETIITGKSEPCLVPGCQQEIKLRDRRRSIVGVIVRYTVKGSQWKIKDKIGKRCQIKALLLFEFSDEKCRKCWYIKEMVVFFGRYIHV